MALSYMIPKSMYSRMLSPHVANAIAWSQISKCRIGLHRPLPPPSGQTGISKCAAIKTTAVTSLTPDPESILRDVMRPTLVETNPHPTSHGRLQHTVSHEHSALNPPASLHAMTRPS